MWSLGSVIDRASIAYMARSARTVSSAWLRRECNSWSISRRHLRIKLPIVGVINSKPKLHTCRTLQTHCAFESVAQPVANIRSLELTVVP